MARTYRLSNLTTSDKRTHLANKGQCLAEGLTRVVAFRWADGFPQTALMNAGQALEHKLWCKANAHAVTYRYARSVITGRFVAL